MSCNHRANCLSQSLLFGYLLLFQIAGLFAGESESSPENIILYSHYETPPFVTGLNRGLTFELAKALTQLSANRYHFTVQILPRKRLDIVLDQPDWKGIVPWVNPIWFRDENKLRFIWSEAIMQDENLVISHRDKPVKYQNPNSLINLQLGGILGHRYFEIETLPKDKIFREDVASEVQNIEKLLVGRIDVMFISKSSLNFYLNKYAKFKQQIFIAKKVRSHFERHLLLPKDAFELSRFINQAIHELRGTKVWRKAFLND